MTGRRRRRWIAVLTAGLLMVPLQLNDVTTVQAFAETTAVSARGSCGENASWSVSKAGGETVLTISGTGIMEADYEDYWSDYSNQITKIIIEDGITQIGDFREMPALREVEMSSSVTRIKSYAFQNCEELRRVKLSSNLRYLEEDAFAWCSSLESIVLPDKIRTISEGAFLYCSGLKSVTLPRNLVTVGPYAFQSCGSLETIDFPDSVTRIDESAFADCYALRQVSFPAQLIGIGNGAFASCTSLTEIEIPDGTQSIEDNAFRWCDNLSQVSLPDSLESIGSNVFDGCQVSVYDVIPAHFRTGSCGDGLTYIIDDSGFMTVSGTGELTASSWKAYRSMITGVNLSSGVTGIGEEAFSGCEKLEELTIPDSVQSIGAGAFRDCWELSGIRLPSGLTRIEDETFLFCWNLKEVTLPDTITSIGRQAFQDCAELKNIDIPGAVKTIGFQAFSGCHALPLSALPSRFKSGACGTGLKWTVSDSGKLSVTGSGRITSNPWEMYSSHISYVNLASGITGLCDQAFYECWQVTSIIIPEGVKSIGAEAFYGCTALSAVSIPDTLTSIGEDAFCDCSHLKDVYYTGTEDEWLDINMDYGNDMLLNADVRFESSYQGQLLCITGFPDETEGFTGEKITIYVEAEGEGLTYQWYVRSSESTAWKVSSCRKAENSTTLTKAADGRQLYVVVTDKYGNTTQSDIVTIRVMSPFGILTQPEDVSGSIGERVSVTVEAEGDGLTYQWFVRDSEDDEWRESSCKKAVNSTKLSASANGRQLYVLVRDQYCNETESDIVTLTIRNPLKITQQPQDVTGDIGDKVTLEVKAEGDGLTYQWYVRGSESEEWKKSTRTTAANSTKLTASSEGRQLCVEVTDKYGNTVKSDVATLHLRTAELKITSQPEDVTGTIGQKITLTVVAEGEGLTYQWYVRDSENDSWRKSSCTKASNSTKLNAAADGRQLYVVVTDSSGASVESRVVTLHVK